MGGGGEGGGAAHLATANTLLTQWIALLARYDWLLKLQIASAIQFKQNRSFSRENCNR